MNKEHILKENYIFQKVIKENKPYKTRNFILYIEKNTLETYKFGFSVGKKIGNAVTRNKIKRQLKHIISKNNYQNNFNCIIIVGKGILNKNFDEIEKTINIALKNLKLIKGE